MKIHTKPETKPYCCKKLTMVPLKFRAQVKADIEADIMKGILERVPDGEPDTWCSRLVIQEKKNGKRLDEQLTSLTSAKTDWMSHTTRGVR